MIQIPLGATTAGAPQAVERTLIRPPQSRLGPLTPEERAEQLARSPLAGRYDKALDRESAAELLAGRARAAQAPGRTTNCQG